MPYVFGLAALVFFPFGMNTYELPKMAVLAFGFFVLLLVLVIPTMRSGEISVPIGKYFWLATVAWLVSLIFSTVFSDAPLHSFFGDGKRMMGLLSHLIFLGYFFLALELGRSSANRERFYQATFWFALPVVAYALLQKFGVDFYPAQATEDFVGRVFSTMGSPNFLGQYLIFPFWIGCWMVIRAVSKKRYWYGLLTALIFLALLFTENRASILGIVLAGLMALVFFRGKKWMLWLFGIFAAGAGLYIALFASSLRSLSHRFIVWESSGSLLPDAGVFGFGLDRFTQAFERVMSSELLQYEFLYLVVDRAHQFFLDLWIAQGAFGMVVVCAILGGIVWGAVRSKISWNAESVMLVLMLFSLFISLQFGIPGVLHWSLGLVFPAFFLLSREVIRFRVMAVGRTVIFSLGLVLVFSFIMALHFGRVMVADTLFASGQRMLVSGELKEAREEMILSLRWNPFQEHLYTGVGEFFLALGNVGADPDSLRQAEYFFEKAADFKGKDFRYFFEMALTASAAGEVQRSETFFQEAERISSAKPVLYENWAFERYSRQDYRGTVELAEKYLALIPEYWKLGKGEKYRLFLKHSPRFPELMQAYRESLDQQTGENADGA